MDIQNENFNALESHTCANFLKLCTEISNSDRGLHSFSHKFVNLSKSGISFTWDSAPERSSLLTGTPIRLSS